MSDEKRRVRKPLLFMIILGLLGLIAVWYDRTHLVRLDGDTSLTVEFVVTDAASGQPIERAEIVATNPENQTQPPFKWVTDRDGIAHWQGRAKWGGRQSGLRFTNTHSVQKPFWLLQVSAPGYEQTKPTWLHEIGGPARLKIVETGPGQAKLVVPISPRKSVP